MDNAEEVLQALEEFTKLKPKDIPKELDEYLGYVAKTGDPVYQWHLVKHLFHEKLSNVIKDFYETSPTIDLPPCPNVDPFNYERLRTSLLERLDTFSSAPFTVQRICELLTNPRKQYNRVDKFMRAIEKNILVVSTREPGIGKRLENEQAETVLNGIPDKLSETEDRIINVCSDNLQFSNSDDSTQIPVVLHACVIQEEIEIANSLSASATVITTESKGWCENENEKDADLDIKTELADNSEINVVSTTSSTLLPNSELPKNSNILFTENEMKDDNEDNVKTASDSMVCNEPIGSSTPDSPDSPEPSSSENLCRIDNLNDESIQPETETENDCSAKENDNEDSSEITKEVTEKESDNDVTENPEEIVKESSPINDSNIADSSQVEEEIDIPRNQQETEQELKTEESSPEHNQPDSSNDSYQNSSIDSKGSSVDAQDGNILQNDDDLTNASEISTSEPNISVEVTDVTSSLVSAHQEDDETTSGDLVVKEIEEISSRDEIDDSEKTEEIKCVVIEEVVESNVTNEETVVSDSDCVSIQEITEVKEEQIEDTNTTERSEIVESSNEISEEICEEQERKEGSIIHATPSVSVPENESQTPTSMTAVEDICVDQASCSTEDEAMDVDESSNQQMITSEGENEAEPMDQSDVQSHS